MPTRILRYSFCRRVRKGSSELACLWMQGHKFDPSQSKGINVARSRTPAGGRPAGPSGGGGGGGGALAVPSARQHGALSGYPGGLYSGLI